MVPDSSDLALALRSRRPLLWINPQRTAQALPGDRWAAGNIGPEQMGGALERFRRFRPVLRKLFAEELGTSKGVIESPLVPAHSLQRVLGDIQGRLFIKADHMLPVAGSIKARGGLHEVMEYAEGLARQEGLIVGDDLTPLLGAKARALFGRHQVAVGSTGNLGLSIGVIASALGFRATVHMSADAKAWKKERLRRRGVTVVEHQGDYAAAVEAGRQEAASDPFCHFVDDERSSSLFLGYAAAASHLARQLAEQGRQVDDEHPLLVYIPCGVGGAPGGIAFGLAHLFGPNVRCFFAEPTASPCFLVAMMDREGRHPSVYDMGLDNRTEADGLAVPRASECAVQIMRPALAGVFTVSDEALFRHLHLAATSVSLRLEPSAAAAFDGPAWMTSSDAGRAYLAQQHLANRMSNATHVVWTTGGLFVPESEYRQFFDRGRIRA